MEVVDSAAVEEIQETEDDPATENEAGLDDAVTNPDTMAQALIQRLQELFTETFQSVADSKAESESFRRDLHQYVANLKSGVPSSDPAQFRLVGGMGLSWLEGEKSRRDARVALDKLHLVLGQLQTLTQDVGAAVVSGVKQAVEQGRVMISSLGASLKQEEKQGSEDELIQRKIQAGTVSAADFPGVDSPRDL